MWSLVVEPFVEFDFLRRALFESIILSFGFSAVGLVLITRRLSLIGDTLSHAMLPGVVVAFVIAGPVFSALFVGGWVTGFFLLSAAWWLSKRRPGEGDAVLALFSVFSVAAGMLIASRTRTTSEILHLLFGNILAIDTSLLSASAAVGAITWVLVLMGYRAFHAALVDPDFFRRSFPLSGLATLGLLALCSAHLTLGFAGLGAMMTVGLLIVPALVGRQLGRSPLSMMLIASVFGAVVSSIGVLLSFHVEVPSGPAIVAVACFGLLLTHVWTTVRNAA